MTPLLQLQEVSKSFRGLRAVANVSVDVAEHKLLALIGPNGAGKTTIFNLVAGNLAPDSGAIIFNGRRVDGLRPDQVCAAGIGRTFQLVKPFAGMSVLDNVLVGALHHAADMGEARRTAAAILAKLELGAKCDFQAATLTLPERKRLELARALATRPKLLLLDEVLAGLRPTECDRLVEVLREINRQDRITMVLIEHVMRAVMAFAQRLIVLHHGEVIVQGTPGEVVRDPAVLQCYLGEDAEF